MGILARIAHRLKVNLDWLAAEHERQILHSRLGHVGIGGTIGLGLRITSPEKAWLGDNVHIGSNGWIRAEGGLRIGDNTHISRNVVIYTVNHNYNGKRLPYDDNQIEKPVTIGNNVWIGMNVTIAPGTTIGEGAIIALGANVSGTISPCQIVASQALRVIGHRDLEHYELLKAAQAFGGADGALWP